MDFFKKLEKVEIVSYLFFFFFNSVAYNNRGERKKKSEHEFEAVYLSQSSTV